MFTSYARDYSENGTTLNLDTASDKFIENLITWSIITHKDKLQNMHSIGTSCLCNSLCEYRQGKKELICSRCYAVKYLRLRKTLRDKLAFTTWLYNNYEITEKQVPFINDSIFRFESFGDIHSVLQVKNYFTICNANKNTIFAIWTKNPGIMKLAIQEKKKPNNLIVIYSDPLINGMSEETYNDILKQYPFIDKIFVVYEKDFAIENNIEINCGGSACVYCGNCYTKKDVTIIREIRK